MIIVGLSVGLTRRNQNQQQKEEVSSTVANENLDIFGDALALALLESTPLHSKDVVKPSPIESTTRTSSRTLLSFFQAS